MRFVHDLMALWPSVSEFARDIGVKPSHAQTMKARGRIPVDYFEATVEAASRRGFAGVTYEALVRMHARQQPATSEEVAP